MHHEPNLSTDDQDGVRLTELDQRSDDVDLHFPSQSTYGVLLSKWELLFFCLVFFLTIK